MKILHRLPSSISLLSEDSYVLAIQTKNLKYIRIIWLLSFGYWLVSLFSTPDEYNQIELLVLPVFLVGLLLIWDVYIVITEVDDKLRISKYTGWFMYLRRLIGLLDVGQIFLEFRITGNKPKDVAGVIIYENQMEIIRIKTHANTVKELLQMAEVFDLPYKIRSKQQTKTTLSDN